MLAEANKRLNLTAVPEERFLTEHFIDSLTLCQTGKIGAGQGLADIGTGAGFPGLPIKIAMPGIELHLIEANAKKAEFLKHVISELALRGAYVHKMRAEEAGRRPDLRAAMDVTAARAVAGLPVLLEYALPLLRVGGWFLAMKGPRLDQEMAAAREAAAELGGRIDPVYKPFGLPEDVERVIALAQKTGPTADKYPRRAGLPAKRPLGGEPH